MNLPSATQVIVFYILCEQVTSMSKPVSYVTMDERTNLLYMLVGEETEIIVDREGGWQFL
ncbi:hypothetical protein NIES3974_03670 [Calothrix sp. NIES-3974]|nr:hypothetical protein NIES3974_03670 [Calothrix sp. NIES-3974]